MERNPRSRRQAKLGANAENPHRWWSMPLLNSAERSKEPGQVPKAHVQGAGANVVSHRCCCVDTRWNALDVCCGDRARTRRKLRHMHTARWCRRCGSAQAAPPGPLRASSRQVLGGVPGALGGRGDRDRRPSDRRPRNRRSSFANRVANDYLVVVPELDAWCRFSPPHYHPGGASNRGHDGNGAATGRGDEVHYAVLGFFLRGRL
mmetsp:Transcript_59535/g.194189  ORF Transcript_59535/g.194189 Transcript_59535/m.194189 type:complete len:205 (+) Transcript_59535:210-824(+)